MLLICCFERKYSLSLFSKALLLSTLPKVFFMGGWRSINCNYKWDLGGLYSHLPKVLNPSFLLDVTSLQKNVSFPFPSCLTLSLPWLQTSFIAFRQVQPRSLLVVHIFSFIITTYLKEFIGIKSLNTVSRRIICLNYTLLYPPYFQKCPPLLIWLVAPTTYGLSCPFLQNLWWKPCRWGEKPPPQQKIAHILHQKNPPPPIKEQF